MSCITKSEKQVIPCQGGKMRREEIVALALAAFEKCERERMLGMANTPTDYDERKKAAIEYAVARSEAADALHKLDMAINAPSAPTPTAYGN